ncbi:uncharacterized protein LOC132902666 [Amyelois transitella]|uniref:uncharacterized protein LOC132902666 n=1 Tax=Amyelois transitella TaxID=680683 RepID=UPI0029902099|nr:uncharacterized protein LOC132902666 [Amyelois transitella]
MSTLFLLIISWLFFYIYIGTSTTIRQEYGVIDFYDSSYVINAEAFTIRKRRGEPYKTNVSATLLYPWGNNVTLTIEYKQKSGTELIFKNKICISLTMNWIKIFLLEYFNPPIAPKCPLPAGTYHVQNVELPPKHFPLPLPTVDSTIVFRFKLDGRKVLLQISVKVK